jgi:hypothetical protein
MYPLNIFNLFPPFPHTNNVFVAMSFNEKFDNRWENVIKPAIYEVGLKPYRVDMKTISDSIITEIVSGIGNCRLFFADVTTLAHCENRSFRNENVLYEVGIAHSSRLPEEVILFRSDNDPLMFDLSNIRVNRYDPDVNKEEARNLVTEALKSAISEIDLQQHLSVQRAVDSLNYDSIQLLLFMVLIKEHRHETHWQLFPEFENENSAIRSSSMFHLINSGIVHFEYPELECGNLITGTHKYALTSFGKVVAEVVTAKFGLV